MKEHRNNQPLNESEFFTDLKKAPNEQHRNSQSCIMILLSTFSFKKSSKQGVSKQTKKQFENSLQNWFRCVHFSKALIEERRNIFNICLFLVLLVSK